MESKAVTEMKVRGGEKSRDWRQVSMKGKERKGKERVSFKPFRY